MSTTECRASKEREGGGGDKTCRKVALERKGKRRTSSRCTQGSHQSMSNTHMHVAVRSVSHGDGGARVRQPSDSVSHRARARGRGRDLGGDLCLSSARHLPLSRSLSNRRNTQKHSHARGRALGLSRSPDSASAMSGSATQHLLAHQVEAAQKAPQAGGHLDSIRAAC